MNVSKICNEFKYEIPHYFSVSRSLEFKNGVYKDCTVRMPMCIETFNKQNGKIYIFRIILLFKVFNLEKEKV